MTRTISGTFGATVALAATALLAACSSPAPAQPQAEGSTSACGRKIAFFGALTGPSASIGTTMKNGVDLAVEQYNVKHRDCTVGVEATDSEGDPAKAGGLALELAQKEDVVAVVGPAFSGESEAANPTFESAGIPLITPSATRTTLSGKGWKVFHRAVANDDAQGPAAGNYLRSVLRSDKVFVVDDQSAYGAGLADAVKGVLGTSVVGTDKVAAEGKQTDFSATVSKVKASGATAVFYGGYFQNAGLLTKQLRDAGVTAQFVAGDGVNDPGFAKVAGNAAAEGAVVTCPCAPANKAGGTFVTDYRAKYGTDPGTYADVAFDATNVFLTGIEAGRTTRAALLDYLGTVEYAGVANTYKFTATGELDPSKLVVWAFTVKAGAVVADREVPRG